MNENPVGKINCQRTQKVGQNRVKHCMMVQSHVKTFYRIAEDPHGRNMQQKTGEMQSSRGVEAKAFKNAYPNGMATKTVLKIQFLWIFPQCSGFHPTRTCHLSNAMENYSIGLYTDLDVDGLFSKGRTISIYIMYIYIYL